MNIEFRPDQIETFAALLRFSIDQHSNRLSAGSSVDRINDRWDRFAVQLSKRRLEDLLEMLESQVPVPKEKKK